MKNFKIILLLSILAFSACKKGIVLEDQSDSEDCNTCLKVDNISRSEGQAYLSEEYAAIDAFATSTPCNAAATWIIIPIGSKACGGPTGFIAYSNTIDEAKFLKRVENYSKAQMIFNKKWGIASTCDLPVKPSKVECIDGKPKLIK
jgi:hypothetical protein